MEKRKAADAQSNFSFKKEGTPDWTKWSVGEAVKSGYVSSGWVFRAVNEIANAASSVSFHVEDIDGKVLREHHITRLLDRPNPSIPRQELFSLYVQWLQLAGNAYAKKVKIGNKTTELWAMSPDKIAPVSGGVWVGKYALKGASGSTTSFLEVSEVIHFKLSNPANPLVGISPLEAAAKPVDTDVEQQTFNKIAMKNRGIMDGVFVFKDLAQNQWETVREKIREMFSGAKNARTPAIIGSEAEYIRTGLTPAEMDFIESRKFNRDEILLIFGVPPQLVGVQDSSTYNNFQVSRRVFWEETVIPLLIKLRDTLQLSFYNELEAGEHIVFDVANTPAMQESITEKIKVSKALWNVGVPFSVISKRLELGIDDFEGSEKPWGGMKEPQSQAKQSNSADIKIETRSKKALEEARAKHEEMAYKKITVLFAEQRKAVVDAIAKGDDAHAALSNTRQDWIDALRKLQLDAAIEAAS